VVGVITLLGTSFGLASATLVQPGEDFFATVPGPGPDGSEIMFPADFFFPGSNPAMVPLEGVPLFFGDDTDTIVRRSGPPCCDMPGDSATVDIELVALSLRSIAPVDIGGSLFDIEIFGGSYFGIDQRIGSMTITRDLVLDGGTFDALLPVDADLVFTEVGNPANFFDVFFQDNFQTNPDGIWSHDGRFDRCANDGFHPGVDPDSKDKVPTFEQSALALHVVIPCQKDPSAIGGDFIPLDTTMVLTAGAQYTAAWMIPVIVSVIGFAIVIARKF